MNDIYYKKLEDLKLMYVEALTFPNGITEAWNKLEQILKSLKGRKFYGSSQCINVKMEYRACVIPLDDDEPKILGLETFIISASNYAVKKLKNWAKQLQLIPEIFDELSSKHTVKKGSPFLEYYKSEKDVLLMVPITSS